MQGGGVTQHLRTRRGKADDVSEEMRRIKSLFILFLLIFASVFLNSMNLTRRRRKQKSIAISAVLSLILDVAAVTFYPVHVVYPLLVVLSTAAAKYADSIRVAILAPCFLFSLLIVLLNDTDSSRKTAQLSPVETIIGSVSIIAIIATFAQRLVMRFLTLKNIFCACSTCYSVLTVKSLATMLLSLDETSDLILSVPAIILGILGLSLARRFTATSFLSIFSLEFSSWSLLIVSVTTSPVWWSAEGRDAVTLALSGAVSFMVRYMSEPSLIRSENQSLDDPVSIPPLPMASTTVARSRKMAPLPTIELGRLEETSTMPEEFKHSDFAVAVPSTAETSSLSEDPTVVIPTISLEHFVEMDIDEDELFNKISNSNV